MKNSLYIGRIAGIKLFIHWTFPLIILWIIYVNVSAGLTMVQMVWSVLFVLTLFFCVVLHELGHALTAKRYHINTRDITLLPIGGVARLEKMPEKPRQELHVALAGPAVNVVIFLVLFFLLRLTNFSFDISSVTHITKENFLFNLALLNIWLALFNLIPAFPMDGGRVLRALLAMKFSRVLATRIAARIGQLIAILFVFAGFFWNPFLIFIGLFIFLGAAAEAEQVQTFSMLKGHTIESLTMKQFPVLDKSDTIDKAVQILLNGQAKNFLVMDRDVPFGTLNREGIIKALTELGGSPPVESVTNTNPLFIEYDTPLEDALRIMQRDNQYMILVRRNGELQGVVDMENILEYIMVLNAKSSAESHKVEPV